MSYIDFFSIFMGTLLFIVFAFIVPGRFSRPLYPGPREIDALDDLAQEIGSVAQQVQQVQSSVQTMKMAAFRAEAFLLEFLTQDQRYDYASKGYFAVVSDLGNVWRIGVNHGFVNNLYLMNPTQPDVIDARFCAHAKIDTYYAHVKADTYYPPCDHYLTQALALMTDEASVMRVAMRSYRRRGNAVYPRGNPIIF